MRCFKIKVLLQPVCDGKIGIVSKQPICTIEPVINLEKICFWVYTFIYSDLLIMLDSRYKCSGDNLILAIEIVKMDNPIKGFHFFTIDQGELEIHEDHLRICMLIDPYLCFTLCNPNRNLMSSFFHSVILFHRRFCIIGNSFRICMWIDPYLCFTHVIYMYIHLDSVTRSQHKF